MGENQNVHNVGRVRRSEICVYLASKGDPHETVALEETFFSQTKDTFKAAKILSDLEMSHTLQDYFS